MPTQNLRVRRGWSLSPRQRSAGLLQRVAVAAVQLPGRARTPDERAGYGEIRSLNGNDHGYASEERIQVKPAMGQCKGMVLHMQTPMWVLAEGRRCRCFWCVGT